MLENTHPDEFGDASVSLTIYDGEKVYGFYGKAKVAEEAEDSVQHIEIMGHKKDFMTERNCIPRNSIPKITLY